MFVLLNFEKEKGIFWGVKSFIRSYAAGYYTEIVCPRPKNKRHQKKLIKRLKGFDGKILYPFGGYKEGMPRPYSAHNFKCRVLMKAFLSYLRKNRPDCAAINWNSRVSDDYCTEIGKYVGRLILSGAPQNRALQLKSLHTSGTPIIYGGSIPKGAVILDLDERACLFLSNEVISFGHGIFDCPELKFPTLPKAFNGHGTMEACAAIAETWKQESFVTFFVEEILKSL